MSICKDCIHYEICDEYVSPCESFPETDGCRCFKDKADVVEVVRCKDCKYRYVPCRCALWFGSLDEKEYFSERGEDFYCSYGERREE